MSRTEEISEAELILDYWPLATSTSKKVMKAFPLEDSAELVSAALMGMRKTREQHVEGDNALPLAAKLPTAAHSAAVDEKRKTYGRTKTSPKRPVPVGRVFTDEEGKEVSEVEQQLDKWVDLGAALSGSSSQGTQVMSKDHASHV